MARKSTKFLEETNVDGVGAVKAGTAVTHDVFGRGTVGEIVFHEDSGVTINVDFGRVGSKWLVREYAKLKP